MKFRESNLLELSKEVQEKLFISLMNLRLDYILLTFKRLLVVLNRLVEKGNAVIIIEHNLDVIH